MSHGTMTGAVVEMVAWPAEVVSRSTQVVNAFPAFCPSDAAKPFEAVIAPDDVLELTALLLIWLGDREFSLSLTVKSSVRRTLV